jgi:hypothetical protein
MDSEVVCRVHPVADRHKLWEAAAVEADMHKRSVVDTLEKVVCQVLAVAQHWAGRNSMQYAARVDTLD